MGKKLREFWSHLDALTVTFIVAALIAGSFFALGIPLGYGDDEYAHAHKAYSVSRGKLIPRQVDTVTHDGRPVPYYGGHVASSIVTLERLAVGEGVGKHRCLYVRYMASCGKPADDMQKKIDEAARAPLDPGNATVIDFGGAGSYLFAPYIPAATGMGVGDVLNLSAGDVIKSGRLFSVLAYTLIVGAALFLARGSRVRWIIFAIGLLPQSIVMAATIGVDMLLNAAALLLLSLLVLAFSRKHALRPSLKALLIITGVTLPLLKPPYLILSLIIPFLPIFPRSGKWYLWRVGTALALALPAGIYMALTAHMGEAQSLVMHAGATPPDAGSQAAHIVSNPFEYARTFYNSMLEKEWFSSLSIITHQRVPLPDITLAVAAILITVASLACGKVITARRNRTGILLVGLGLIGCIGIATGLYVGYTPVGNPYIEGVQGRYFIPCLGFIALGIGVLVRMDFRPNKVGRHGFISAAVVMLAIACTQYLAAIA